MDVNSTEFNELLGAWVDALKVMDTKLNAYYSAVGALENSEYRPAASYFKSAVIHSQNDPVLLREMTRKYDLARRKLDELLQQSHPAEAVAAWLREYRPENPKVLEELP
jgi:hypothetical protein